MLCVEFQLYCWSRCVLGAPRVRCVWARGAAAQRVARSGRRVVAVVVFRGCALPVLSLRCPFPVPPCRSAALCEDATAEAPPRCAPNASAWPHSALRCRTRWRSEARHAARAGEGGRNTPRRGTTRRTTHPATEHAAAPKQRNTTTHAQHTQDAHSPPRMPAGGSARIVALGSAPMLS